MVDRSPHIVIVVVNLPVERDRRVIRECQALEAAGYRVSVICPRGPDRPRLVPGTRTSRIHSFPQPLAGSGLLSFAAEFTWALTAVTARLVGIMARDRVDAVQACNPPDIFWIPGLLMRLLGRPFVFDHHDLSPELYECKTGRPNPVVLRILRLLEKASWRSASAVVSTNESYRDLAISRGGCDPDRVVVVRNGPTIAEVDATGIDFGPTDDRDWTSGPTSPGAPGVPSSPQRAGRTKRIVYLGVINPQDHVEVAVLAAERLVALRGADDWQLSIAGDGDCLPELRRLAAERGLADVVRFTGWLDAAEVDTLLRSATLAIQPDAPTRMAELSTMAKTVEYVARGVPVVAVDLLETRRTAGSAASYLPTGGPDEFAKALDQLLDDAPARNAMRVAGRRRFVERLAWDHQVRSYIRLWNQLLPRHEAGHRSVAYSDDVDAASPLSGRSH
ncbi:glycosyltransferase family 4 protein [Micromonospora polyrhachis]|uniref:Glycosyltransferase involved in cell wall biosynthesis n=1 Tax=Micromonospora polyrhachis TaxID=1282883 RepID=A0A7W7WRB4_9ACTN|nr:glycosyltransferase family 4 protein [Micromonospora polyrhachis]MBB4960362.1 glycosyltransferase involved in cell wall biosynthesis [Micromonospora polyrhachis]